MDDEFTLKLNSPITEEQWDSITDVDFENAYNIWFHTKHGKYVEFIKPVRCKDCENYQTEWEPSIPNRHFCAVMDSMMKPMDYCSYGERRKDGR